MGKVTFVADVSKTGFPGHAYMYHLSPPYMEDEYPNRTYEYMILSLFARAGLNTTAVFGANSEGETFDSIAGTTMKHLTIEEVARILGYQDVSDAHDPRSRGRMKSDFAADLIEQSSRVISVMDAASHDPAYARKQNFHRQRDRLTFFTRRLQQAIDGDV